MQLLNRNETGFTAFAITDILLLLCTISFAVVLLSCVWSKLSFDITHFRKQTAKKRQRLKTYIILFQKVCVPGSCKQNLKYGFNCNPKYLSKCAKHVWLINKLRNVCCVYCAILQDDSKSLKRWDLKGAAYTVLLIIAWWESFYRISAVLRQYKGSYCAYVIEHVYIVPTIIRKMPSACNHKQVLLFAWNNPT